MDCARIGDSCAHRRRAEQTRTVIRRTTGISIGRGFVATIRVFSMRIPAAARAAGFDPRIVEGANTMRVRAAQSEVQEAAGWPDGGRARSGERVAQILPTRITDAARAYRDEVARLAGSSTTTEQ